MTIANIGPDNDTRDRDISMPAPIVYRLATQPKS